MLKAWKLEKPRVKLTPRAYATCSMRSWIFLRQDQSRDERWQVHPHSPGSCNLGSYRGRCNLGSCLEALHRATLPTWCILSKSGGNHSRAGDSTDSLNWYGTVLNSASVARDAQAFHALEPLDLPKEVFPKREPRIAVVLIQAPSNARPLPNLPAPLPRWVPFLVNQNTEPTYSLPRQPFVEHTYRIMHFFCFLTGGSSAATMASSNTSFSLYCVKALHSTYLTAPRSLAILSPSSFRTGAIFCFASLSRTCESSRKSVCVPTMRHGTPGQW